MQEATLEGPFKHENVFYRVKKGDLFEAPLGDATLTGNCHCFLLAICHRIDRSSKFDRSKTENSSQSDNLRNDLE